MPLPYTIARGDRFELRVTLTSSGGTPYNLTTEDQIPRMELRRRASDQNAVDEFAASVSGADNNIVTLILGGVDTLALPVGSYEGRLLLQHNADPQFDQITPTKYMFNFEDSSTRR